LPTITTDGVSANVLFVTQVKRQAKEDFDEAQKTRREALLQAAINDPCNTVSVDLGINSMLAGTVNGRNALLWNLPPEERRDEEGPRGVGTGLVPLHRGCKAGTPHDDDPWPASLVSLELSRYRVVSTFA